MQSSCKHEAPEIYTEKTYNLYETSPFLNKGCFLFSRGREHQTLFAEQFALKIEASCLKVAMQP